MLQHPPPAAAHIIHPTPTAATPLRLPSHVQLNADSDSKPPSGEPQPIIGDPAGNSSGMSIGMVAGITAGGCAVAILILILLFVFWRKRNKKKNPESDFREKDAYPTDVQQSPGFGVTVQSKNPGTSSSVTPLSPTVSFQTTHSFMYEELERATDGFSKANLLGEGGFGYVHKGVLPNGKVVAVKQLKVGSCQGEREFQAEVDIISRVQHKHLVSLVGYCLTGHWRMLVYEFVPNNNLEFHLHGNGRPAMDWSTRLKVALGAAKGLAYLHEDCHLKIIHRDIKASNILLDLDFEAKVADFGLAKLFSDAQTHVSTRVMGTFGYLAPEYAYSGKLTEKSDVFSFGVLLLELITGRPPVQKNKALMKSESLVDWARPLFTQVLDDGNLGCLVDPAILQDGNRKEMGRMVACAAACVFDTAKLRPKMSQVVMALQGDASLLFKISREMSHINSRGYNSYVKSPEYDTAQYKEDMKKFRQLALGSTICASSDQYSSSTGEQGSSSGGQPSREMEAGKVKMKS